MQVILDSIDNASVYTAMTPRFEKAFSFLSRPDLTQLEEKCHDIDGDRVFATIMKKPGRPKEDGLLEAHERYIDIQMVLAGVDLMGWKPVCRCKETSRPYDPENDVMLFSDPADAWVATHPGQFAVFFPGDAHIPLISQDTLHKAVVKVAV